MNAILASSREELARPSRQLSWEPRRAGYQITRDGDASCRVRSEFGTSSFTGYTDLIGFDLRRGLRGRWDVGVNTSIYHSYQSKVIDYGAGLDSERREPGRIGDGNRGMVGHREYVPRGVRSYRSRHDDLGITREVGGDRFGVIRFSAKIELVGESVGKLPHGPLPIAVAGTQSPEKG